MKVTPMAVALFAASLAVARAEDIGPGTVFPLVTDGASPTLISAEVQHITADNTIDVAILLTPPSPLPDTQAALLLQLAEFCIRYQQAILDVVVPAEDHDRLNAFAPIYMVPIPGKPRHYTQYGFGFQLRDDQCTLEEPFPQELVSAAREFSAQALPGE